MVLPHHEFTWRAFQELGTCRPFPAAAIPWTAIDAFARRHELEGDDYDSFESVIRHLDTTFFQEIKRRRG